MKQKMIDWLDAVLSFIGLARKSLVVEQAKRLKESLQLTEDSTLEVEQSEQRMLLAQQELEAAKASFIQLTADEETALALYRLEKMNSRADEILSSERERILQS